MILYLHGFRSSPRSYKASVLAAELERRGLAGRWRCPQLPMAPADAIAMAEALTAGVDPADVALIGSSLGGYYATWLAERHGFRAMLLNPAIVPVNDLERYLGEQPLWHGGGTVVVEPAHLEQLRELEVPSITRPERYYLIATTGDEVLDYRSMLDKYRGVATTLIEGSDHGISHFEPYMDRVLDFCLGPAPLPPAVAA